MALDIVLNVMREQNQVVLPSEILRCLSLACASGSLRRTTQVQLQGAHQRPVAPIGQGCDHEARLTALILEAVVARTIDHADLDLELRLRLDTSVVLHGCVVAQLRDPLKACDVTHIQLHDLGCRVSGVHIGDDERLQRSHIGLAQVGRANKVDQLGHFLLLEGKRFLQRVFGRALDRSLHLAGPLDLVDSEHDLLRPCKDPSGFLGSVELVSAVNNIFPQTIAHLEFHLGEPILDRSHLFDSMLDDSGAVSLPGRCILVILIDCFADLLDDKWIDRLVELHLLIHGRDHARHDELLFREVEQLNALEALVQMVLHAHRILRLGQNVQQVVIREEEKAWEEQLLRVEILVQLFLHVLNCVVAVDEVLIRPVLIASI